jgi:hypothetical protein
MNRVERNEAMIGDF